MSGRPGMGRAIAPNAAPRHERGATPTVRARASKAVSRHEPGATSIMRARASKAAARHDWSAAPIVSVRGWQAAGLALLLATAGCAPVLVMRPGATRATSDSTRVAPGTRPTTRPGAPITAAVDSAPSPAALGVLASIPEPLALADRVPPPEGAPADSSAIDDAPADSLAPIPDPGTGEVPVPSPTPKLGDIVNPGLDPHRDTTATRPDSMRVVPAPTPPLVPQTPPAVAQPRVTTPPPAATDAACWRVQIQAPKEKAEANRKRAAAESILLVPMVIEREGGLYKIRTRECFSRATADVVRGRAVASGFSGAFPFEGAER